MANVDPSGATRIRGQAGVVCDAAWLNGSIYLAVKTWKGDEAELRQSTSWHSLNLTIEGGSALTGARIGGELFYEGIDEPGALTFVPAGVDRHGWYSAVDLKYVGLYFHPSVTSRLTPVDLAGRLAPRINGREPLIQGAMSVLAQELERGEPPDLAMMEHTIGLFVHRLQTFDLTTFNRPDRHGRLTSGALQRIATYVDAHLASKIALSALAELLDMPVYSFAHAFKQSTGVAPYQYVLRRRVRRAEQLLATTPMPIVDVAAATGFASQSHLTVTFSRFAGQPPSAYRRRRRT